MVGLTAEALIEIMEYPQPELDMRLSRRELLAAAVSSTGAGAFACASPDAPGDAAVRSAIRGTASVTTGDAQEARAVALQAGEVEAPLRGSIALVPAEAAAKHAPLMAFFPVLAYRRLAQEGLYVNRLLHVRNEEASYSAERDGHRLVHRVNAVTFTADAVWTLQRRGDWFATTSFDARFRNTTGVTCDLRLAIEPAILSATGQPLRLWPFGEVEALSAQQGSCQLEFTEYTIATAEVAWATTLCSTGLACAIPLAIAPAHWGVALARLDAFVQSHIHNPA